MERLICKSILWKIGFTNGDEYNRTLDSMFLKSTTNDILLELESFSSNCDASFDDLHRYWKYEIKDFPVETFGKCMLEDLSAIYFSNSYPIKTFAQMCYSLWQLLPDDFNTLEPFHILSYADDPLSWNDEEQTRKIYEELFESYK
ncbi:MAG: hypothetical protein IKT46_04590 [Clostridia bacterium]|nr:hypothetical protein [Clostridia bacterium]